MRSSPVLICAMALLAGACGGGAATSSDAGVVPGPGGEGGGGAGGDAAGAPADAFVALLLGAGPSAPATSCNVAAGTNALAIGSASTPFPQTMTDGAAAPGGSPVHISCSVTPSGSGFDVALAATLEGPSGGSLTISSPPGAGAVTASGASGITATLQIASEGTYREADCSIALTYQGAPVPDSPAVATGRIWGHLSCPRAVLTAVSTTGPEGGVQQAECDAEADFLFEDCAQ